MFNSAGMDPSVTSIRCDGKKDCANPVTHVGSKGYVYCESCAPARNDRYQRSRRMRNWELKVIACGERLESYTRISQAEHEKRKAKTAIFKAA
jgi:hypothetical protein